VSIPKGGGRSSVSSPKANNFERSSAELSLPPKWLVWLFVLVSFAGFLDASYLTAKHYLGTPIGCSIFEGCEKVTTSQYATIGAIPVALLGAIYYLALFALAVAYLDTKREKIMVFAAWLTPLGFLASLWFVYLQLFVIKAICLYCLISALTSTALFVLGLFVIKYHKGRIC
jgi:uncharacterized membrane protein